MVFKNNTNREHRLLVTTIDTSNSIDFRIDHFVQKLSNNKLFNK